MNPQFQASPVRALRRAFTKVELLVLVFAIGALLMLVLPALTTVHPGARKALCASNLHQIALALHGYQEANHSFPPSINFPSIEVHDGDNPITQELKYPRDGTMFSKTDYGYNWAVAILPYLELKPLYMSFEFRTLNTNTGQSESRSLAFNDSYTDADGKTVRNNNYDELATTMPIMLCPDDDPSAAKFQIPGGDPKLFWGRGNYAVNAANGLFTTDAAWQPTTQGVMDANRALSSTQIHDGLAYTMLLGEIRIGVDKHDPRGTWALGTPGASSLWAHGTKDSYGMAASPNPKLPNSETILYGSDLVNALSAKYLEDEGMSVANASSNQKSVVRSAHPGGAHVAMCDGSVLFVNDSIDSHADFPTGSNRPADYESRMGLWQRMIGSNDSLQVDLSEYLQ